MIVLGACGCSSIGPGTVPRDRVDYITAVAESWKEQTLLNIVRLRYNDAPSFLDVSSVISTYSILGQLSANGAISSDVTSGVPSNLVTLGGSATYQERPTISYTPVMGNKFAKSLLEPIPPTAIFELAQAGYPADRILQVTTRAINGVFNRSNIGGRTREADPEFYPVLDALRRLQLSGAVSLRTEKRGADDVGFLVFSSKRRTTEIDRDLQFVQKTLDLKPGKNGEVTITFGAIARNEQEIAVLSRSMLDMLQEVSAGIDVPSDHVSEGRTVPASRKDEAQNPRDRPVVHILSGPARPSKVYAAVRYHDTWYWIDDDDYGSKGVFTFLMMFFALAETGVVPQTPVLTVPAS